jgi:hypothetical protein
MTDDGTLPDRLRNMVRNPNAIGTHSAACWQWHDDCALLLAADRVAERDADVSAGAVARTVAMSHIAAERDAERAARERAEAEARQLREAIGDPDELRWHRWHCEETGQGDDLRELLVRIADAADAADVAVAEGAEDRGQTDD